MAVLSPYSAQKSKILEMVKQLPSDLRRLKVASITESQGKRFMYCVAHIHLPLPSTGDEYGIVILSTVRSLPLEDIRHPHYVQADRTWMRENLGFITDRHQINVGITRSKYGLIITGKIKATISKLVVSQALPRLKKVPPAQLLLSILFHLKFQK